MNPDDEKVREIIACQAGEWVAAHQAGGLDAAERRAFYAWLMASPVHVEEYLEVALLSRRLPAAAADPELPVEAILDRVREETEGVTRIGNAPHSSHAAPRARPQRRWLWAAVPAGLAAIAVSLFWLRGEHVTPERYATRHGEMRSWRLGDNSTLRLNTDTSVTARYTHSQRLIEIERGEVLFEVAHESARPFRVIAGTASVLAVGTTFSVYRQGGSTLVTVVQGRVGVSTVTAGSTSVNAGAGEQVRVMDGQQPQPPTPADVQRSTAWLHRQIIFERRPLALVTAEFNRYSPRPIDIETPALGTLPITGIFSVDDTETFLDFLRTFDGVTIQATPTRIRVFQAAPIRPAAPPAKRRRL
jgi:transmembrane sensor